jgi:hypothetical protein
MHCAQESEDTPTLLHRPEFERIQYAVSFRQLTQSLQSKGYGRYGDAVQLDRGLAVSDPASDLGKQWDRVKQLCQENKAIAYLIAHAATYEKVLKGLGRASWWFYAGHGFLSPTGQLDIGFGAVLELADNVLTDLDLLLRVPMEGIALTTLAACVSGGMNVSSGNEIVGFVRALKVYGAGPVALCNWEVKQERAAEIMQALRGELFIPSALTGEISLCNLLWKVQKKVTGVDHRPSSAIFGLYV